MTDASVAPLVSATSVMLAAFGFLYNTQRDRFASAGALEESGNDAMNKSRSKEALGAARASATLAVSAAVPGALLLPEVVREVRDAVDIGFSLREYSTIEVVFVVLALTWWLLVLMMVLECRKHLKKARALAPAVGRWRHLISRPT